MTVQDVEAKQGWYAGIELTARTRINVTPGEAAGESRPIAVRIGLQEDAANRYFTRVGPGERFEAPKVFIGCYGGDVDDGANRLRKWVRTNLTPATHDPHYPLLVNNSWGSGMAVDERLARKMIDESAELGLELFHIDAGWFRTVGDWRPNEKKFPRGLGPVADYAHEKGLKFGLWVGWTQGGNQVDPTGEHRIMSPLDPAMADWFYQDFPKNWKAGEFTGATACLGDPKVVDWCLNQLRAIVKQDKLDLLEHDQTMVLDGCAQRGHLHTPSRVDVGYRAALGYYRVYDTLRAENPNLLFENCVNGGHMVDYGAVRRCHYISITDTYDPLSNRRAFYDASYAAAAGDVRMLHRERCGPERGAVQVDAPERDDGVVHDHDRHEQVDARAARGGEAAVCPVQGEAAAADPGGRPLPRLGKAGRRPVGWDRIL